MKTLLFNLNKVVKTGDEFHRQLYENTSYDIEVFEGIVVNLKINLKEKLPPGTITFTYNSTKDLIVYQSRVCKEPHEDNN